MSSDDKIHTPEESAKLEVTDADQEVTDADNTGVKSADNQGNGVTPLDGGRRSKKRTRKNHKNKVIVGKVYAKWCGHCKTLKPEWAKMKNIVLKKKANKHISFAEFEEGEKLKLSKFENANKVSLMVGGYPTLFKVSGGNVEYYNGERNANAMKNWAEGSAGGSSALKNAVGGFRRRHHRRTNRRFRHVAHSKGRTHKSRTPRGIFSFLFKK